MAKESDLLLAKNQKTMKTTIISIKNTTHVGNDNQHMTSLEIAELTGKNHFDLMRAIRKMEPAWEKTCKCKFAFTSKNTWGQSPCDVSSISMKMMSWMRFQLVGNSDRFKKRAIVWFIVRR